MSRLITITIEVMLSDDSDGVTNQMIEQSDYVPEILSGIAESCDQTQFEIVRGGFKSVNPFHADVSSIEFVDEDEPSDDDDIYDDEDEI